MLWVVLCLQCKCRSVGERTPPCGTPVLTLGGHVISLCYVGFASLEVVCDELNDFPWDLGL